MRLNRIILPALLGLALSACATVDLANMASSAPVETESAKQSSAVKYLSAKLVSTFEENDWASVTASKRGQSTGNILLKGLTQKAEIIQASTSAQKDSANALAKDIREAEHHVFQLSKAAEKYYTLATSDMILRDELASLEQALLASRQAEQNFSKLIEGFGEAPDLDMAEYAQSVLALRSITDEYGQHVRNLRKLSNISDAAVL